MVARNDDHLNHLVQQLGLAAPEPREILLHDREHIVLVAADCSPAVCGVMSTCFMAHSGEAAGGGSSTMTSSAAPLICCRASASMSAGSSTTCPRAAVRRYADGFMRPSASASISFSVSAVCRRNFLHHPSERASRLFVYMTVLRCSRKVVDSATASSSAALSDQRFRRSKCRARQNFPTSRTID